ncbi:MAG: helix-hairpin-helix domain-containing protein [Polaromonas sp.]|nr:helix-hairpin-helix domain-containing protein [Polaromonas sp.]
MFKKLLAFLAALSVFAAFAAVDVNKGSEAELDGIKGIGPATSRVIIAERQKAEFKSWEDFMTRVKGIRAKKAAKFSAEGLTVGGASYQGTMPPAVKKTSAAAKADATVAPASAAKK